MKHLALRGSDTHLASSLALWPKGGFGRDGSFCREGAQPDLGGVGMIDLIGKPPWHAGQAVASVEIAACPGQFGFDTGELRFARDHGIADWA